MIATIKKTLSIYYQRLLTHSLRCAMNEQGLSDLVRRLEELVPDITDQYSSFKIDTPYLNANVRNIHAFQIALVNEVIDEFNQPTIVDIGDSSGTHLEYILKLHQDMKKIRCLSVNLDSNAVEKIRKKGMEAVHARAEELQNYNINADIFLCFATLEHLSDPCRFLHELSSKTNAKYLIVTIPYQRHTRVGMYHIRNDRAGDVSAENTHIVEFCPEDFRLIAQHSGWKIQKERIYYQYPRRHFLRLTRSIWKRSDFEGFYGVILAKDSRWSSRYTDW